MAIRERAQAALASFHPAPIFLEAYRSQRLPLNLDIYFGPPEEFFLFPDTEAAYTGGRLIPILDDGNFGIVTFYDPDSGDLLQKDVESPREVRARLATWQQYLADLMIRIAETIEDDDEVRDIAELIGFRYYLELMAFLEERPEEPFEEYHERRRVFIGSLSD
jgi:hypothetical protein